MSAASPIIEFIDAKADFAKLRRDVDERATFLHRCLDAGDREQDLQGAGVQAQLLTEALRLAAIASVRLRTAKYRVTDDHREAARELLEQVDR